MPLDLCILASGSGGNCSVLRCGTDVVLLDIGIGPTTTARRLDGTGVSLDHIRAAVLTHLDSDHFNTNWVRQIVKRGIRVHCHEKLVPHVSRLARRSGWGAAELRVFDSLVAPFDGKFAPLPNLRFDPIHLTHDTEGSHGFVVHHDDYRVGFATDLGHVTKRLIERFIGVDVLCLESNYDPRMQLESPRPLYLKQRIMDGSGHLSNEQSFDAIRAILDRCELDSHRLPSRIVLLHRSRQCNCPELVKKLFSTDRRVAPRLVLTDQFSRTEWIDVAARVSFESDTPEGLFAFAPHRQASSV